MGDHRARVKCIFSMHDHKAEQEWDINWNINGCDPRIVEWFDAQTEIAMSRFFAEEAKANAAAIESAADLRERQEYERLKAKFEP